MAQGVYDTSLLHQFVLSYPLLCPSSSDPPESTAMYQYESQLQRKKVMNKNSGNFFNREDIQKSALTSFYIKMAIFSLVGGFIWRTIRGASGADLGFMGFAAESLGSATVLFILPLLLSFIPAVLLRATSIGYRRTRLWASIIIWVLLFIVVLTGAYHK
jgi:uncharacterized membrane protein YtjA (UPF0391 family)